MVETHIFAYPPFFFCGPDDEISKKVIGNRMVLSMFRYRREEIKEKVEVCGS